MSSLDGLFVPNFYGKQQQQFINSIVLETYSVYDARVRIGFEDNTTTA